MKDKMMLLVMLLGMSFMACQKITKKKIITMAHTLPISHPVHKSLLVFKDSLASMSNGRLVLKIYPDAQLGSEREILEQLQIGSLAMTKVSSATMANFVPEYKVLSAPFLFRDKAHFFKVVDGPIGRRILDKGERYWLYGLAFFDAGSRSFYTKKKLINKPEDLKGLKIRVMNDPIAVKTIEALGGSPTPMAYGELYTALQQGVVDGAENNPPSFVTSRHFEICKYYTLDKHTYTPDVILGGTKFLATLSEEDRSLIKKAVGYASEAQKIFWKASVDECFKILKENDVKILELETKAFQEQTANVRNSFKADSLKQLIKEISEIQ